MYDFKPQSLVEHVLQNAPLLEPTVFSNLVSKSANPIIASGD